ncbi:MAG: pyridoxal-dependent decarboxylase [Deltaproteobacteria bacterium]|nr:pyridoxal-dependent decarboxylase [Deltaproteobacteria bacterium]
MAAPQSSGSIPPSIADAYDPERFRRDGHALIDALADQLAAATGRDEAPVLALGDPTAARAAWAFDPAASPVALVDTLTAAAAGAIRLHHPRYLGHQVPPPIPGAALGDLVSALCNNGMSVYEMGPTAMPIEFAVIDWMAQAVGLPSTATGVLTSGGSVGNLTALLAARQARAGWDVWGAGDPGGPPLAVLCSSQVHYSIARALRIMGWGADGAIAVPVDDRFRLDPAALPAALERARALGRRVIAVVASAGATATGAFDPLLAIGDFCAAHGLWLHVDGAHGAALAISKHRALVDGLARADSIVWDAHKMLAMPALCTAVLFREPGRAYEAFAQEASYLFEGARPDAEWWNLGLRTLECTKRMMALKLYACLRAYGPGLFTDYVERTVALGAALAARLAATDDFELATPPDANIVCYRWRPRGAPAPGPALDAFTAQLRRRAVADGRFYILQTRLGAGLWLRSALMNPLTEDRDLDELLDHVRALGADLVTE